MQVMAQLSEMEANHFSAADGGERKEARNPQ
jgi:hypothetical protein